MNDPLYPTDSDNDAKAIVDYLLIAAGAMFILMACGLFTLLIVRQGGLSITDSLAGESLVYNGETILRVAAGSRNIEELAFSNQVPVVVMFDADW